MSNPVAGFVGCILYALTLSYLIVVMSLPGSKMSWRWAYVGVALILCIASHAVQMPYDYRHHDELQIISNGLASIAGSFLIAAWSQCVGHFKRHCLDGSGMQRDKRAQRTACWKKGSSFMLVWIEIFTVIAFIGAWFYPMAAVFLAFIAALAISIWTLSITSSVLKAQPDEQKKAVANAMPTYQVLLTACIPFALASAISYFVGAPSSVYLIFATNADPMVFYYINLAAMLGTSLLLISTGLAARHYGCQRKAADAFEPQDHRPQPEEITPAESRRSSEMESTKKERTSVALTRGSTCGSESTKVDTETKHCSDEDLYLTRLHKFDQTSLSSSLKP